MKFAGLPFMLASLALMAVAAPPQKAILVSFPKNTSPTVLAQVKQAVISAGGAITQEYEIIMGFAATVPEEAVESITALGKQSSGSVEADGTVNIYPTA
ncbi:MAG: hypothetical protein M1832_001077 [Thelocarpon impressellum]|nr:MAG: hypothetical protein M1832_001077 [Thelocarpon impressellum]